MTTLQMIHGGSSAIGARHILLVDEDRQALEIVSRVAQRLDLTVRTARHIDTALEMARMQAPVILMAAVDIGGQPIGLSLGRAIRKRSESAVVLIGAQLTAPQVASVAAFNPDGYLCKPLRMDQVEATLRLALKQHDAPATDAAADARDQARQIDFAHALRQIAVIVSRAGAMSLNAETTTPGPLLHSLRPREQEVVQLLFEHCRVPAIAERLGISPDTVRNHLKNVFKRLGVHSQQELLGRLRGAAAPVPPTPGTSLHVVSRSTGTPS